MQKGQTHHHPNGATSSFHHGYTLGESYEIVVNSGKVTAVGGVGN